jgi:DNA end-binding protein Ku
MPRASWSGFLRLSLVTCPVYLTPATTEAKRIRLNQLNLKTGNRLSQRLVDSKTGEEVGRDQIVKGYEFDRDRYVTIDDDELKELQVESSKIIDLDRFVSRDEVDPLYLDAPYYVYPEGELAAETFRVIGEAMAHTNKVGLGRITMSGRERPVLVEPRGEGLLMSQLRSSDEVRPAEFAHKQEEQIDPDLVALAETIIERKSGTFEPAAFRDRYQDALRALVDSKLKGEVTAAPHSIEEPPKVVNLMDALKRSLAREEASAPQRAAAASSVKRPRTVADRRQPPLLLPVSGGRGAKAEPEAQPAVPVAAKRRKARAEAPAAPAETERRRKA